MPARRLGILFALVLLGLPRAACAVELLDGALKAIAARGEVVIVDDRLGVTMTEIIKDGDTAA